METYYIIKKTYQGGPHDGKVFYLGKDGYVIDYEGGYCFYDDCYQTKRAAKMVATRYNEANSFDVQLNGAEKARFEAFPVEFG